MEISFRDVVLLFALALSPLIMAMRKHPRTGRVIHSVTRAFRRLARSSWRAALLTAVPLLAIRISLLPVWPKPIPSIYDEFSYLLMADTFTLGRMTNPTPPAWQHFETEFVQLRPTYQSVYPVVQGLFLTAGAVLFRHPWWGVCLSMGIFAAALCWMLEAWVPRHWAVTGALLGCAQFGLATYWMNSYWGGASSAIGGALVLGAWRRLERRPIRPAAAFAMTAGLLILANARPFEGFVLSCVVGAVLLWRARRRPFPVRLLLQCALLFFVGGALSMFYFWRVTGNPLVMPYQVAFQQYAATGMFFWSAPRNPVYNNVHLERFYKVLAVLGPSEYKSISGIVRMTFDKLYRLAGFYIGPTLFAVLLVLPATIGSRKTRPLAAIFGIVFGALFALAHLQVHYAAPIASLLVLLSVLSLRRLWMCGRIAERQGATHFGPYAVIALCTLSVAYCGISVFEEIRFPQPVPVRNRLLAQLNSAGGKHLVLVHYGPDRLPTADEWIYNDADLARASVIWARDLGPERNGDLIRAFAGRTLWCVDPESAPFHVDRCGQTP